MPETPLLIPDLYRGKSSPLGPPETSLAPNPVRRFTPSDLAQEMWDNRAAVPFRHRGWQPRRQRILYAMRTAEVPLRRLHAFDDCGRDYWVQRSRSDPSRYRTVLAVCHDRWCTPCQRAKAAYVARRLRERLQSPPYRLLTLTLRHSLAPLASQLDRLQKAFLQLRRDQLWRERVFGGAAFVELKLGANSGLWHPHLHVILEGYYVPRPHLSRVWEQITTDSTSVDLRYCENTNKAAYYVTKYLTKAVAANVYDNSDRLAEAVDALSHRRCIETFGSWRRWPLCRRETDPDWEHLGMLSTYANRARLGDPEAERIVWGYLDSMRDQQTNDFQPRPPPDA